MKHLISVLVLMFAFACGPQREDRRTTNNPPTELDKLKSMIADLVGTQAQINALVMSDYASCNATPTDGGSTNDSLVRKICQIAQASTVEAKVQLKGELEAYINSINSEVTSIQARLSTVEQNTANVAQVLSDLYGTGTNCSNATSGSLCFRVTTLENSVATLNTNMTNAQSAISTLQSQVASINSTLATVVAGAMLEVTIGNENLSAGPLFESVLRKQDRSRINAYIESVGSNVTFGNNPVATTNGSPSAVFTLNAHGLTAGQVVKLDGLQTCNGIPVGSMNDQYSIASVTTNTFTITLTANATSTGSCGGNNGYYQAINGRGLGQEWQTSDGEVIGTTTFSVRQYKFLITGSSTSFTAAPTGAPAPTGFSGLSPGAGWICYDKTNRSASAATIKAGGSNVLCK